MNLTNEFLQFVYFSLTDQQQDAITVKYYIAKNKHKTIKELQEDIIKLPLKYVFIRSDDRIRKIKKYEVPEIIKRGSRK